ncbi:hypothetical protein SCA6_003722, partial [Theobroma cacao]
DRKAMAEESIVCDKMKLLLALLALHSCFAGFHIVSRVALNIGVSKVVYPVYRNIIALLLLSPFAYFLEKKDRPPLTFPLLVQFFLLALLGVTANQGFYLLGLYYASPTFASAMQNSVPAITFVMASALRLEQINIAKRDGLAKVLGTIASAPVLKKYPAKLTLTSFTCFFGLTQFLVIAAFVETDFHHWKIQSKEELLTILYAVIPSVPVLKDFHFFGIQNFVVDVNGFVSHNVDQVNFFQGVVASGIVFSLQTWCIYKGGPVIVAIFQPLQTLLVAIMAFMILGDQLYSGSVIGAVFIMVGLYLVLWGKTEEKNVAKDEDADTLKKHLLNDTESRDAEEGAAESNTA